MFIRRYDTEIRSAHAGGLPRLCTKKTFQQMKTFAFCVPYRGPVTGDSTGTVCSFTMPRSPLREVMLYLVDRIVERFHGGCMGFGDNDCKREVVVFSGLGLCG